MKTSYMKISNLCNIRLFLFLVLFVVSSCQINQSVSILKEKLFSETDETNEVKKVDEEKISKSLIHDLEKLSQVREPVQHIRFID